jgi:hypothetical protein
MAIFQKQISLFTRPKSFIKCLVLVEPWLLCSYFFNSPMLLHQIGGPSKEDMLPLGIHMGLVGQGL